MYTLHVDPVLQTAAVTFLDGSTGEDFVQAVRDVFTHPDWSPEFTLLWDATSVKQLVVTLKEVEQALREVESLGASAKPRFTAFVAPNEDYFALAQLFVAKRSRTRGDDALRAFKSRPEALRWLGLPGEAERDAEES